MVDCVTITVYPPHKHAVSNHIVYIIHGGAYMFIHVLTCSHACISINILI